MLIKTFLSSPLFSINGKGLKALISSQAVSIRPLCERIEENKNTKKIYICAVANKYKSLSFFYKQSKDIHNRN